MFLACCNGRANCFMHFATGALNGGFGTLQWDMHVEFEFSVDMLFNGRADCFMHFATRALNIRCWRFCSMVMHTGNLGLLVCFNRANGLRRLYGAENYVCVISKLLGAQLIVG